VRLGWNLRRKGDAQDAHNALSEPEKGEKCLNDSRGGGGSKKKGSGLKLRMSFGEHRGGVNHGQTCWGRGS